MHVLRDFPNIRVTVPTRKIYKRLGYRTDSTLLDQASAAEMESAIAEAYNIIVLKGRALRLPVTKQDQHSLELNSTLRLTSDKLSHFFSSCEEALLMAATCGSEIIQEIKELTENNNQTRAVIYDAAASELADLALDWIMELYSRELLHEGKNILTRRYSAGYGDFKLENQIYFYNLLQLDTMGVTLTDSFVLTPEKTVTALTGITAISTDSGDEA
jgi:hypothetical protein